VRVNTIRPCVGDTTVENHHVFASANEGPLVQPVETSDPDGVDYGWVMQTTFVLTIVVGAPVVAALSLRTPLPTWGSRVTFAIRVGAVVWIVVAISVFAYARRYDAGDGGEDPDAIDRDGGDAEPEALDRDGRTE
jgi:hypothetical protein